jgi:hypothetical protein
MKTDVSQFFTDLARLREGRYQPVDLDADIGFDEIISQVGKSPNNKIRSRLSDEDDLWSRSRIALILADIVVLSGNNYRQGGVIQTRAGLFQNLDWPDPDQRPGFPAYFSFRDETILRWLEEARPFVEDGRLIYLPERGFITLSVDHKSMEPWILADDRPWRAVMDVVHGKRSEATTLFSPSDGAVDQVSEEVFKVTLPFLDRIPLDLLYKVMRDEDDTLSRFRKAMASMSNNYSRSVEGVEDVERRRTYGEQLRRDVVDPEIAELNLRFRRIVETRSLRIAGATLGTLGLCGTALSTGEMQAIVGAALGAGGAGLLFRELSEMRSEILALKDHHWYFAWRLRRLA